MSLHRLNDDQRALLAWMFWEWLYGGDRRKSWTADELGSSPQELGYMVRQGWLQSHKWRRDIPRTYMPTRDGWLSLIAEAVR